MRILSIILPIIFVTVFFRFLNKKSYEKPKIANDGKKILQYSVLTEVLGWVSLIVVIGLMVWGLIDFDTINGKIFSTLIFLAFATGAIYLILVRRKHRILYNDQELESVGPLGKVKKISWNTVTEITFNPAAKDVFVKNNENTIGVGNLMIGFPDFLEWLQKNIPTEILGTTIEDVVNFKQKRGF